MKRIYGLEIRRILKNRKSFLIILFMIVLSVFFAWLPLYFVEIDRINSDGSVDNLHGKEALEYLGPYYSDIEGEVTVDKLKDALTTYQDIRKKYGDEDAKIPKDVRFNQLKPAEALCRLLPVVYASEMNGNLIMKDLNAISVDEVNNYYDQCTQHIKDVCRVELKPQMAEEKALELYSNVDKPFYYHYGYTRDAFDYVEICILFIAFAVIISGATVFSYNYETNADYIIRTTKNGKSKFAISVMLANLTVSVFLYIVCIAIHLTISDTMFGMDTLKTSVQALYDAISLPNLNLFEFQMVLFVCGLITIISVSLCTFFVSALCKKSVTALAISIFALLIPIIAYNIIGEPNVISSILPSGGIGLQNSLLYQLVDFRFVSIGNVSLWSPMLTMAAAVVEIPVLLVLSVVVYNKHKIG